MALPSFQNLTAHQVSVLRNPVSTQAKDAPRPEFKPGTAAENDLADCAAERLRKAG
ncbi:hypothetical protein [Halodurantibacterium flavum]|uniref:Uncharacterized protein n=1 Tax=Halodurantibacterium flavum TaxID=1382802 RepID=A0ABW4S751_9RHOB